MLLFKQAFIKHLRFGIMLDVDKIRKDFQILKRKVTNNKKLIYFDNAATTQKPKQVIQAICNYYKAENANIHRGIHFLSNIATEKYEKVREKISKLFNCFYEEVVFTKSTTEGINLISYTLANQILTKDDNILITESEHHANIVPWLILQKKIQFKIKYLPIENGIIAFEKLSSFIDQKTKILSFCGASNVFGVVYNIEKISQEARKINPNIVIIVDGAQYIPHKLSFNFKQSNIDFLVFSGHKIYGPTGVGVLIGKKNLLENMPPFLGGGDMIKEVDKNNVKFNTIPHKFEGGTQNISGVIGLGEALNYINELGEKKIIEYENYLNDYLEDKIKELNFLEIYSPLKKSITSKFTEGKIPLTSFNLKGFHPHDLATLLDIYGIAIRSGHHCAQIAMKNLNVSSTARISLCFYNTIEEIDKFIKALINARKIFS